MSWSFEAGSVAPADAASGAAGMICDLAAGQPAESALDQLEKQAGAFASAAMAAGTRRTYAAALKQYAAWSALHAVDPLGGEAGPVRLYMTHLGAQKRAVATIRVALAAIGALYRHAGLPFEPHTPELARVLKGITRTNGTAPRRQAKPATLNILQDMLAVCGPESAPLGARNRAMLLLGFGAALRRSELVGLDLLDVELVQGRGIMVTLHHSKTDQEQGGEQIAVPANDDAPDLCPVRALGAWLEHRNTAPDMPIDVAKDGIENATKPKALFCAVTRFGEVTAQRLSDKAVVRLVKETAAAAGHNGDAFSGHSLRAGLITEADAQDAALTSIMRQARQKKPETTLRYTRPNDLWRNNAAAKAFSGKG
jgi:site-specific recombinase XerD